MISVLVCDDHRLFGESFAAALRGEGARVIVTSHPDETIAMLEAAPVDRMVMNVRFPGGSGVVAIRHIRKTWPQMHVSCVGVDDPELLQSAIDAGAQAVLSKKRPLAELVETVLCASWAPWCGAGRRQEPLRVGLQAAACEVKNYPLAARFLTNREREVLQLLVSAQSTYGIADELGISVTTTRGYVQSILTKFGVHSRVEAVAYAARHSITSAMLPISAPNGGLLRRGVDADRLAGSDGGE
jgi:two-component system nitrate/nitrite response regulator NarL